MKKTGDFCFYRIVVCLWLLLAVTLPPATAGFQTASQQAGQLSTLPGAAIIGAAAGMGSASTAADIRVEAEVSESEIFEGEILNFKVEIKSNRSKNVRRPELPELDGFRSMSMFPQTSSSHSYVRGVTTITYGYTWQLRATGNGVFIIPPVKVEIEGQTYETDPVTVTVLRADERKPDAEIADRPDIFIELRVSDLNPVRGQQVVAEIIAYFKSDLNLTSYQVTQSWTTEGFWQEDLNSGHSARAENILLDGVRYRKAVLRRYALFPTRQGSLELGSYSIRANVRYSGRNRESYDFFRGFRSNTQTHNLISERTTLSVRDLPQVADAQFINAVGDLRVERRLSDDRIKLGESVEVITEISGTGNIALITRPEYQFPADFDIFKPQERVNLTKGRKISGKKTFRDVIIARSAGSYHIPESRVAVYNDDRHRYETVVLPAMQIEVVRDPNARIGFVSTADFDVKPVMGVVRWSMPDDHPVYRSWWFWAGLLLPVLIVFAAYHAKNYRYRLLNDEQFRRYRLAGQTAGERLKSAKEEMHHREYKQAYSFMYQALAGFIADRCGAAPTGHSDDRLAEFVSEKTSDETLANEVRSLLTKCSTIRYAPQGNAENVMADIKKTGNIIDRLNRST